MNRNGRGVPFSGEQGKSYSLYSLARDNVGNAETAPAFADAQTTIITNPPLLDMVTVQITGVGTSLVISNMVQGVNTGFTITQELIGVGYRCESINNRLTLTVGYSHPIVFVIPTEVTVVTKNEKGSPPTIILTSADKQLVGQIAAKIRAFRAPEPYKGKGIRFQGEILRRKAGKTAGKGKK